MIRWPTRLTPTTAISTNAAVPRSRSVPVRSTNPSSIESGSTSGETDSRISNTRADASAYASKRGGTTIACGHFRFATTIGIADRHPNGRAS